MKKSSKISLIVIGSFFAFPFLFLLALSFMKSWVYPVLFPHHLSFINWKEMIRSQDGILKSFFYSLIIALFVAVFSTFAGFIISRFIAFNRHRGQWIFASYAPYILSPVIYAVLLNYFFIRLGLSGNIAGVMLGQLIIALPFSIILFTAFWDERIKSLEEVSYTLGGSFRHTFFKLLLPVAKPQLLVCFFQTFLISWFEYGMTSIIGVGKVQTLTIKVYQYIEEANLFYAALSSCIIIFPPIILLWLNRKFVFTKSD